MTLHLGTEEQRAIDKLAARAEAEDWAERLFDGDTSLWTDDPDVSAGIVDRLGWLDAPEHFAEQAAAIESFGDGADVSPGGGIGACPSPMPSSVTSTSAFTTPPRLRPTRV